MLEEIDDGIRTELAEYCDTRNYAVLFSVNQKFHFCLKNVENISIEFMPYLLKTEQGAEFVSGLIEILSDKYR